jgi:hypothetical protein
MEFLLCFIMLTIGLLFILDIHHRTCEAKGDMVDLLEQIEDEITHLKGLRAQVDEDLKMRGKPLDETMLGSFVFGRSKIINDDSVCCVGVNDFGDREFDSLFIVKRKSTPADEVLQMIEKGKLF